MSHFHKLKNLSIILKKIGSSKRPIFLVAGKHVRADSVLSLKLNNILKPNKVIWHSNIKSHPTIQDAKKIIKKCERVKPSVIIAIGGASVLDLAKVALGFKTATDFSAFIKNKKMTLAKAIVPFIAIPTTFGSGSETTPYAVVYGKEKKYSIEHALLTPQVVISDARLAITVPKKQIASAGLDCIAEAVEALWSVSSTKKSDQFSRRALTKALISLPKVYAQPKNLKWQNVLASASYAVGQAIAITHTTAPHAFSYPLSIKHHIPHGIACSLTLAEFLKYNSEVSKKNCLDQRGELFVRRRILFIAKLITGQSNVLRAALKIQSLQRKLKIPARLRDWGVMKNDLSKLLSSGLNPERLLLNPRQVTSEDAKKIYQNIY